MRGWLKESTWGSADEGQRSLQTQQGNFPEQSHTHRDSDTLHLRLSYMIM